MSTNTAYSSGVTVTLDTRAELDLAKQWLVAKKQGGLGVSPTKARQHIDAAIDQIGGK